MSSVSRSSSGRHEVSVSYFFCFERGVDSLFFPGSFAWLESIAKCIFLQIPISFIESDSLFIPFRKCARICFTTCSYPACLHFLRFSLNSSRIKSNIITLLPHTPVVLATTPCHVIKPLTLSILHDLVSFLSPTREEMFLLPPKYHGQPSIHGDPPSIPSEGWAKKDIPLMLSLETGSNPRWRFFYISREKAASFSCCLENRRLVKADACVK